MPECARYPDEIYVAGQPEEEPDGRAGLWTSRPVNPSDQKYIKAEIAEARLAEAVEGEQKKSGGIAPAVLRPQSAAEYIGVSRRKLYELYETVPDFPQKIEFSSRVVGWRRESLDRWLASRESGPSFCSTKRTPRE